MLLRSGGQTARLSVWQGAWLVSAYAAPFGTTVSAVEAQSFTAAQRMQAKSNLGALGAGQVSSAANATVNVTAAQMGSEFYSYGGSQIFNLPALSAIKAGDIVAFTNLAPAGYPPSTVNVNGSDTLVLMGTMSSVKVYPGQTLILHAWASEWNVLQYSMPFFSGVNVDLAQSLSAGQQAQARTNIGAGTASIVASSGNAAAGYRKWSDGFIEQWFLSSVNGDATLTFPIAFASACRYVGGTPVTPYNGNALTVQTGSITTNNFSTGARQISSGAVATINIPVYFYACGY